LSAPFIDRPAGAMQGRGGRGAPHAR
jgi:hypothetical protein